MTFKRFIEYPCPGIESEPKKEEVSATPLTTGTVAPTVPGIRGVEVRGEFKL
jgi:hypothetical protein